MVTTSSPPDILSHPHRDTRALVLQYLDYCKKRHLSDDTIKYYRTYLFQLATLSPELPTAPSAIQDFISRYASDERQHGCFRSLRTFYNWLQSTDETFTSPYDKRRVKAPKRSRKEKPCLTLTQIKTLLEFPNYPAEWIKPCLYLMSDTGCRIGEVHNLRREDITDGDNGPLVRLSGKTGTRIVPISPMVKTLLLSLKPGEDDKLFPIRKDWMTRTISEAFDKAGLGNFTAHSLRHAFCTHFSGDVLALRKITGHTSVTMTENYVHNKLERACEAHREGSQLSQVFGSETTYGDKKVSQPQAMPQQADSGILGMLMNLSMQLGAISARLEALERRVS